MRDIKFRAWDKVAKSVVSVVCLNLRDTYPWHILVHPNGDGVQSYSQTKDSLVLLQYTGLKDKNGKEIYEGDVVCNLDRHIYQIKYVGNSFRPVLASGKPDSNSTLWFYDMEVIGNIYENPELMEV